MRRILLKAYLSVLIYILVVNFTVLPLLRWQLIRLGLNSELFR